MCLLFSFRNSGFPGAPNLQGGYPKPSTKSAQPADPAAGYPGQPTQQPAAGQEFILFSSRRQFQSRKFSQHVQIPSTWS